PLQWRAFELVGEPAVRQRPRGALISVVDASAGRHENQAAHLRRCAQCHVQRHAPAQRVAAQGKALGSHAEHVSDAAGERDRALALSRMPAAGPALAARCPPLVLSLAREPRLRCYTHVDERCAGFFALGLAKASGLPVAVACTSGTAAAELLPAAIEAREARVPLLLLTADRPPELREVGAGQAIDQLKLYGGAATWFLQG